MLLPWLFGCSLGLVDQEPCTAAKECREAFGFGSTCGDDGFCAAVEVPTRCEDTWPEDLLTRPENYADALVIGSLYDHTTDVPEQLSTRLAVKQADESQGIDGQLIGLVQCSYEESSALDTFSSDEAAVAMGEFLVNDLGAYALVGPATSGVAEALYNGLGADGPLIVSPSATSPALTFLDSPDRPEGGAGRLWRTAPPDSLQGEVLAQLVDDRLGTGPRTVALVYQVGPYGEGLAEVFAENWASGSHQADRYTFENDTQRSNAASAAAASEYDAIVFISSDLPDVTAFLRALAEDSDAASMPLFLADAARDAELLVATADESARALWPNVVGTAPAVPSGDRYDAFAAAYAGTFEGKSADDSSYSAYAYDAAWLTVYGGAWALSNEPGLSGQTAAEGLRRISDAAAAQIDVGPTTWNELQAEFAAGRAVDLVGASGALDYDPATEETKGPIEVWAISEDGEFVVLDTIEP